MGIRKTPAAGVNVVLTGLLSVFVCAVAGLVVLTVVLTLAPTTQLTALIGAAVGMTVTYVLVLLTGRRPALSADDQEGPNR